jgi:hypothetical protein
LTRPNEKPRIIFESAALMHASVCENRAPQKIGFYFIALLRFIGSFASLSHLSASTSPWWLKKGEDHIGNGLNRYVLEEQLRSPTL